MTENISENYSQENKQKSEAKKTEKEKSVAVQFLRNCVRFVPGSNEDAVYAGRPQSIFYRKGSVAVLTEKELAQIRLVDLVRTRGHGESVQLYTKFSP